MIDYFALELLILNVAWPLYMAYAWYRVILATGGRWNTRRGVVDTLSAGVGGALAIWGRAIYGLGPDLDWVFSLTVLSIAVIVTPKLVGVIIPSEGARDDGDKG